MQEPSKKVVIEYTHRFVDNDVKISQDNADHKSKLTTEAPKVFEENGQPTKGFGHGTTKYSDDIQTKGNAKVKVKVQVNNVFPVGQNCSESFVLNVQENENVGGKQANEGENGEAKNAVFDVRRIKKLKPKIFFCKKGSND